jgi:serine/threonine-protein kinase HipA
MPRPRKTRALQVWMNGQHVGTWTLAANGGHAFVYAESWRKSARARPLSLSLPLRPAAAPYRGGVVEAWFDNLLPDSQPIRQRIQSRFHTPSARAFDLLVAIGRDCVGAVQLLPEGEAPRGWQQIEGDRLSEAEVAAILRATPGTRQDDAEDFRISLAGAQEKTALLHHAGHWCRPRGATPTTHIFKLPLGRVGAFQGDLSTSVENEWLCARILRAYGLAVAECRIEQFEDQKALVVTRFDRRLSANKAYWLRLPQEDLCQTMGVPPALKYEADGGPGIRSVMDLLLGAQTADHDRLAFFKAQVVFWLLCAPDAHAKNFSVAIHPGGRYTLTPLYDVLSAWPVLGHGAGQLAPEKVKLAMAVSAHNRHYRWAEILPRHWLATAKACGLDPAAARSILDDVANATPRVVSNVAAQLPPSFPPTVSESILRGLAQMAGKLA